jgi:hypothetical protein
MTMKRMNAWRWLLLAARCWTFHPFTTYRAWKMLKGNKQEFVGLLNGSPTIYCSPRVGEQEENTQ